MPVSKTYSYSIIDNPLGINGTNGTYAQGISASDQIVGYYYDGTGLSHGFRYVHGTYVTLDDPSAGTFGQTFAEGINSRGQVVGWFNDRTSDHAFLYSAGTYTTLQDLGTVNTIAKDINASGQIVGYFQDGTTKGGLVNHGFLYSDGSYTILDHPLAYTPPDGTPSAYGTVALGINGRGEIVGYYYDSSALAHGFLYSDNTYVTLDDPLATDGTFATGINDSGQIVGGYLDSLNNEHSFLYDHGNYFGVLDIDGSFSTGHTATGINNAGEIVGYYVNSNDADHPHQTHGFLASPTPTVHTHDHFGDFLYL